MIFIYWHLWQLKIIVINNLFSYLFLTGIYKRREREREKGGGKEREELHREIWAIQKLYLDVLQPNLKLIINKHF